MRLCALVTGLIIRPLQPLFDIMMLLSFPEPPPVKWVSDTEQLSLQRVSGIQIASRGWSEPDAILSAIERDVADWELAR